MKSVLGQLKQYKKDALCTMGFTMLEVIMEVLLPFITALIIDEGLERSRYECKSDNSRKPCHSYLCMPTD